MKAVNLIPADARRGSATVAGRSGGAAYLVIGLLVVIAGMAVLYASAHRQIASKQARATRLSAEAREAESAASALAPYSRFVTLHEQRVSDVKQLAGTRFDWAHTMHELGRVLPRDASLTSVQGTVGASTVAASAPATASGSTTTTTTGPSVTSSTPAGSAPVLTLAGCATSQEKVALTMDRLRLMDGVSEVTLQSSGSAGGSTASGAGCEQGVSFALTVDFESLPTPQTSSSPTASSGAATSSTGGATSSTGGTTSSTGKGSSSGAVAR